MIRSTLAIVAASAVGAGSLFAQAHHPEQVPPDPAAAPAMACPMMPGGMMSPGSMSSGMMSSGMMSGGMMDADQNAGQTMSEGMAQARGGMSGMGLPPGVLSPGGLLALEDELGLSAEQVGALEQLRDSVASAGESLMAAAHEAHEAASAALAEGEPGLAEYEMSLRAAHDAMLQSHLTQVHGAFLAQDLLTEVQRTRLTEAAALAHALSPAMGQGAGATGGMPHAGMMCGAMHGG